MVRTVAAVIILYLPAERRAYHKSAVKRAIDFRVAFLVISCHHYTARKQVLA
jgi:hypothetical protein